MRAEEPKMQSKLSANNVVPPFEELSNPVGIGIFDWKICAQKRPLPSGREREQLRASACAFVWVSAHVTPFGPRCSWQENIGLHELPEMCFGESFVSFEHM
jgi:hypothetical protein